MYWKAMDGRVILNLFAEGVRQMGEAAHSHAHGEVLPLDGLTIESIAASDAQ